MKRNIRIVCALLIIIVVFGTIYVVGQQVLRLSANDPQVQIAQDTATLLNAGTKPQTIIEGRIYVDESLAPFTQIYDSKGGLVVGNAYTGNANDQPEVPVGVLTSATDSKYNDVTWQPSESIRLATVSVKAKDYYVLSGRNMRETEKRVAKVFAISVVGWFISSIAVLAFLFLPNLIVKSKK